MNNVTEIQRKQLTPVELARKIDHSYLKSDGTIDKIEKLLDQFIPLRKGDFFCIPAGIEHRHIALDVPCWMLEISYNYCDQINDIFRLEDNYGRPKEDGSQ